MLANVPSLLFSLLYVWAVYVLVVDVWALPLPVPLPRVVIQYMYSMAIFSMIVVCVPIDDLLAHC